MAAIGCERGLHALQAVRFNQLLCGIAGDFDGFGDGPALRRIRALRLFFDMQVDDVFGS
jgi:hypothetical protein